MDTALEESGETIVIVSSVKCYENSEYNQDWLRICTFLGRWTRSVTTLDDRRRRFLLGGLSKVLGRMFKESQTKWLQSQSLH